MTTTITTMKIGEVASQAGLNPSTLRYYEQIGLIPPPPRASGQRRYAPEVFQRLQVIKLAQQSGFSLAEIHQLLNGAGQAPVLWRELARKKLGEIDAIITRYQTMQRLLKHSLACNCLNLDDCDFLTC